MPSPLGIARLANEVKLGSEIPQGELPPYDDWVCLARAGRDGITPTIRGTYDAYGRYKKLDVVAMDGASLIAKYDNPGVCPGDGWQLMSKQGRQGRNSSISYMKLVADITRPGMNEIEKRLDADLDFAFHRRR